MTKEQKLIFPWSQKDKILKNTMEDSNYIKFRWDAWDTDFPKLADDAEWTELTCTNNSKGRRQ